MAKIAKWIRDTALDFEATKDKTTAEVIALCEEHPIYNY